MPTFTISLRGVPVGVAEFAPASDLITIAVHPLPGYDAVQPTIRAASAALADAAIGRVADAPRDQALRRGAELGRMLELRDQAGGLVPTDFIDLTEWPNGNPKVAAIIRFREAHAAVPASVRVKPVSDADARSPGT